MILKEMKHDAIQIERDIAEWAESNLQGQLDDWIANDVDIIVSSIGEPSSFKEEDRDDINDELEYNDIPRLPDDMRVDEYDKWVRECLEKTHDMQYYIDNDYESIEDLYYDHMDEVYSDTLEHVEDFIRDYMSRFDELDYDEENSHSVSAGRYPSVYFTFFVSDRYLSDMTYEIRFSDGHDNGQSEWDYEIVFDEYDDEELKEHLDEMSSDLLYDLNIDDAEIEKRLKENKEKMKDYSTYDAMHFLTHELNEDLEERKPFKGVALKRNLEKKPLKKKIKVEEDEKDTEKKEEPEEVFYLGVNGVKKIYRGASDPLLKYKGETFNEFDIQDALWSEFLEEHEEFANKDAFVNSYAPINVELENKFEDYMREHLKDYLDELVWERKEESKVTEAKACKEEKKPEEDKEDDEFKDDPWGKDAKRKPMRESREIDRDFEVVDLADGKRIKAFCSMTETPTRVTEKVELDIGDEKTLTGKYYWYNRPWQKYDYEVALHNALYKFIPEEELKQIRDCDSLKEALEKLAEILNSKK